MSRRPIAWLGDLKPIQPVDIIDLFFLEVNCKVINLTDVTNLLQYFFAGLNI